MGPEDLINQDNSRCECLLGFIREIFNYKYEDKPNYNKLRQILVLNITSLGPDSVYDNVYDWNQQSILAKSWYDKVMHHQNQITLVHNI